MQLRCPDEGYSRFAVAGGSASGDSIVQKRPGDPQCPAIVGWISRRRNPTFKWMDQLQCLDEGHSRFTVNDRSASGDSILRKPSVDPRRAPTVGWISRRRNPTSKWMDQLQCPNEGHSRFAVNDGSASGDSVLQKPSVDPRRAPTVGWISRRRNPTMCYELRVAPGTRSMGSPAQSAGYSPARTSR